MKFSKTCVALILALGQGSIISYASADEIRLLNGDRITGKIISKSDDSILVETNFAGSIEIQWRTIAALKTDAPITVQLADDSILKGTLVPSEQGTVTLSAEDVFKTDPIPLAKIAAINPAPIEPEKTQYTGIINLGAARATGNSENQAIHLDAEMIARRTDDRLTVGAAYNQNKDNGVESAKNTLAYAQYDRFVNEKVYIFGNTSFERDRFVDLKLRSILGGGVGYQFWETDLSSFSAELGASYVNEDYYDFTDDDYAAARWAVNYDRWIYKQVAQFFHYHEGLVPFADTADVYIRSRTGVRIPLIDRFTITAEVDVDYDAVPAPGNEKTDTRYLLNVGYHW